MITFLDTKEKSKETENCLDSQLWHACAGSMVQMPPVDSTVFYFPQGHAEHSCKFVDLKKIPKLPSYIPCRVVAIKFMADPETDEVFAKIKLNPVKTDFDDNSCGERVEGNKKPSSFAKTLTQSDANNGGGFSVPRYCAETIFPRLDYSTDPPVQTIMVRDVHGETWKFRHIYRGTPRRHLLTTGWSAFVNHKKLVAGDSIVFLRTKSGELCVGIRRAKRADSWGGQQPGWNSFGLGGECAADPPAEWNSYDPPLGWNKFSLYGGNSVFLREEGGRGGRGDSVVEAMEMAGRGREFEVVYYPRASTPEFCVKGSLVKGAMGIRWCSGMRFKMPFETEDSSRISWFMGTISAVRVADPVRWPDSPWRLLQVTWDEPDLLQNVKHVSPWLVELVSTMPPLHLPPFSPPWKKLRHLNPEFPLQFPSPSFAGAAHLPAPANTQIQFAGTAHLAAPADAPAGMQGARHAHFNLPLPDFHFNKLHSMLFATTFPHLDKQPKNSHEKNNESESENKNVSCLLTMGSSNPAQVPEKVATQFVLFGQPILTEQQIPLSGSGNSSPEGNTPNTMLCEELENGLENGHCKVFMESEDVGRTLDLSVLGSYEELYRKLADMFDTDSSEMTNHVLCLDVAGSVKQIGNEPFSDFMKTAKRLTILTESGSDNVGVQRRVYDGFKQHR